MPDNTNLIIGIGCLIIAFVLNRMKHDEPISWDDREARKRKEEHMFLKAERIISHGDILFDKSEEEIYDIVRRELARKIADECVSRGLIKVEIVNELHDDFGSIVKVRASLRAYNPDD